MEKQFVPYQLAVKLKELGFVFEYFAIWAVDYPHGETWLKIINKLETIDDVPAPLWQQAFDWFRDIKGLPVSIGLTIDNRGYTFLITNLGKIPKVDHLTFPDKLDYRTYEQARQACLENLIELIATKD